MVTKRAQKISEAGLEFLDKFSRNRIKLDMDKKTLSYWVLIEIVAEYFKTNQDEYKKLVKMECKIKNV